MTAQQSNLHQFNSLVAEQMTAARAFAQPLWAAAAEELRGHSAKPIGEIDDAVLADIDARFLFGSDVALMARLQGFLDPLRKARFKLICELAGLGSDADAAVRREDLWDVCAAQGISREDARVAAEQIDVATHSEGDLGDFIFRCGREKSERASREAARWLQVDGAKCAVLASTPVLWAGWECDDKAWVIDQGAQRVLVTTNHGSQEKGNVELLRGKIREYQQAIIDTQAVLALLDSSPQ